MLEIVGLNVSYKTALKRRRRVLRELTVSFPGSACVALIGDSGIGKSTLLHSVAGILKPDSGEIRVGDKKVRGGRTLPEVSLIFQDHNLIYGMSAYDNVRLRSLALGDDAASANRKSDELLEAFGIEPGQKVETLSGGQAARVDLCRALVSDPLVILGDEPTASLDETNKLQVIEILQAQARQGKLVLVSTHDRDLVRACDYVYRMEQTSKRTEIVRL